jgi:hypothetical protein
MRELAVQASNDTLTLNDRTNINAEYTQVSAEVTWISVATKYNGLALLGTTANLTFQFGANNGDTLVLATPDASGATLGLPNTADLRSQVNASAATSNLDTAINTVSTNRSSLGAIQNRLESLGRSLPFASENTSVANSRIADADIAASMGELVRSQILQQAGISVIAQANQAPNLVLQPLKQHWHGVSLPRHAPVSPGGPIASPLGATWAFASRVASSCASRTGAASRAGGRGPRCRDWVRTAPTRGRVRREAQDFHRRGRMSRSRLPG